MGNISKNNKKRRGNIALARAGKENKKPRYESGCIDNSACGSVDQGMRVFTGRDVPARRQQQQSSAGSDRRPGAKTRTSTTSAAGHSAHVSADQLIPPDTLTDYNPMNDEEIKVG